MPLNGGLKEEADVYRTQLVERLANVDEQIGEMFLMEEPIDADTLMVGIRRATLARKFVPVFMGRSATHPNPSRSTYSHMNELPSVHFNMNCVSERCKKPHMVVRSRTSSLCRISQRALLLSLD